MQCELELNIRKLENLNSNFLSFVCFGKFSNFFFNVTTDLHGLNITSPKIIFCISCGKMPTFFTL